MMPDADIHKMVARHVAQISEHVTAVQIIVTVQNCTETARHTHGAGCWYSRMGAIREFVINDNAEIAHRVKRMHDEQDNEQE